MTLTTLVTYLRGAVLSAAMTHPSLLQAHATEEHLLRAICEVQREPDHTLYRSLSYPTFYDGNLLEVRDAGARTMAEWQERFRAHFDPQVHPHLQVRGLTGSGVERLVPEAQAMGYDVSQEIYLCADAPMDRDWRLPEELCIRQVDTDHRWQRMAALDKTIDQEEEWYTPEASAMLWDKKRRLSAAVDIVWWYVSPRQGDQVLAKLGMFEVAVGDLRVCRLQDVTTAPSQRRRGLANALVGHALQTALGQRGAAGVCVCADADYFALDMYRRQGFRDLGTITRLFRMRTH